MEPKLVVNNTDKVCNYNNKIDTIDHVIDLGKETFKIKKAGPPALANINLQKKEAVKKDGLSALVRNEKKVQRVF